MNFKDYETLCEGCYKTMDIVTLDGLRDYLFNRLLEMKVFGNPDNPIWEKYISKIRWDDALRNMENMYGEENYKRKIKRRMGTVAPNIKLRECFSEEELDKIDNWAANIYSRLHDQSERNTELLIKWDGREIEAQNHLAVYEDGIEVIGQQRDPRRRNRKANIATMYKLKENKN